MALNKKKHEQVERLLSGILNTLDTDVLVLHERGMRAVFHNATAGARIGGAASEDAYIEMFPQLRTQLREHALDASATFETEHSDGTVFSVHMAKIHWMDDEPALILHLRDVSEERNIQQRLFNLAYVDQLTCVFNRQRLREDFAQVSELIENRKLCGIVAMFDMDNFKTINDTYGHNAGDVMLRRLADYLNTDPRYAGHLYRLGGDEFVFFFHEPINKFSSQTELVTYYEELLQGAFLNYTMPNIDDGCTLSMGLSAFPYHGYTISELLRKADISLYKAKQSGRNKLVTFEDKYDTAKKFKDLYINIQPILTENGSTWGYELVDRGTEGAETESALNLSELNRTMDALGLTDIQNDTFYMIAFTNQLLNATVLNNLRKEKFIVQIHVGEKLTVQQMQKYRELQQNGYSIALLDVPAGGVSPLLMEIADYVKFADDVDIQEQRKLVLANPRKRFIATNVDTDVAFEQARQAGFVLYQGFYFSYPPAVVKKTKDIDPLKLNYIRLLRLTATDDYVNFSEISHIISSDVALSYKLLRLLRSAALGLRNPIYSIDTALAYLGEENLKQWIAMLALRGVAADKPLELVRMSLIRARFGELLTPYMFPKRDPRHVFLVGMFSLVHIALEKSKEEALDEIAVGDDIRLSILGDNGPHSDLVRFLSDYEYSNWDDVTTFARANKLNDKLITDSYMSATKWYNSLTAE